MNSQDKKREHEPVQGPLTEKPADKSYEKNFPVSNDQNNTTKNTAKQEPGLNEETGNNDREPLEQ
jgi:hypothetical protein